MQTTHAKGTSDVSSTNRGTDGERPAARAPRRIARRLAMLAVVLSMIALVLVVLLPGPTAPGTLMAHRSRGGPATIGATCTRYPGAEVSIQVPGPGTVVVSATVGVGVGHEFGFDDEPRIVVAASSTDCSLNNYTAFVSVPATLPTDPVHFETVPLLRPFPVSSGGTYTYYVNGVMARGADAGDRFDSASLVAVFYPS